MEQRIDQPRARAWARRGAIMIGTGSLASLVAGAAVAPAAVVPRARAHAHLGGTLVIAANTAPTSLNPALNGNGPPQAWYSELAYDSLTYQAPNGKLEPDLATAWHYSADNRVLDLTLRKGVRFSDGSPLTASGVKRYIQYFVHAGGPFESNLASINKITVTGPLSLRLQMAASNPYITFDLSQNIVAGDVIGPRGLSNIKSLGTTTDGTGPYVLDSSASVAGSKYIYVPNKYYWDPARIHWKRIEIEVIGDPTAALDALKTGQVDFALGTAQDAAAAKADGLQVTSAPGNWASLFLFDRSGAIVPALKSVKVRQALNWAFNRAAIGHALFGRYSVPTDEVVPPGQVGYSVADAHMYGYNVAKAKALLAQAGYAHGFTLPMLVYNFNPGESVLAQAIASSLSAIGVNVQITQPATLSQLLQDQPKFPAIAFEFGSEPIYVEGQAILNPNGGALNPLKSNNATIDRLMAAIGTAPPAKIAAASDALETYVMKQGWFAPIAVQPNLVFASKHLGGTGLNGANPVPDVLNLTPRS